MLTRNGPILKTSYKCNMLKTNHTFQTWHMSWTYFGFSIFYILLKYRGINWRVCKYFGGQMYFRYLIANLKVTLQNITIGEKTKGQNCYIFDLYFHLYWSFDIFLNLSNSCWLFFCICGQIVDPFEAIWTHLDQFGLFGPIWNYLELFVII